LSAVQAYLRAGWSLGNVQDRYIFGGAGGDQLVGRAVSGLPINSLEFATLPPHFCRKDLEKLNSIGWNNICPGHQNYPECFKLVIPFLFASLLYHHAWLETTFSPQHPIFQQSYLSNTYSIDGINQPIKNLQKNVLLGINQCLDTNMVATGIPDHLAIAHEVQELKKNITRFEEITLPSMQKFVIEKVDEVPENVKNILLENFSIEGVVPVNMADINRIVSEATSKILDRVNGLEGSRVQAQNDTNRVIPGIDEERFQYFIWGGRFRIIPKEFSFPTGTIKSIWNLWHYGRPSEKIRPFKYLVHNIKDLENEIDRTNVHRANKVMTALEDIAIEMQLIIQPNDIKEMAQEESDVIFEKAYNKLILLCYGDKGHLRPYDLQCNTLACRIYNSSKKRKREDHDEYDN
jgi:hypothetical protein